MMLNTSAFVLYPTLPHTHTQKHRFAPILWLIGARLLAHNIIFVALPSQNKYTDYLGYIPLYIWSQILKCVIEYNLLLYIKCFIDNILTWKV